MLESKIQSKSIKRLKQSGWEVVRNTHVTPSGWPDVTCYKKGKIIFIEFKAPGKKPTELQTYRHEQLRKQGFTVHVVDNPDSIIIQTMAAMPIKKKHEATIR